MIRRFILLLVSAIIFTGCAFEKKEVLRICPGKMSVAESLSTLRSQSQSIVSLKANGQCRFLYYVEGRKKPQSESFSIKLHVKPLSDIYLQGDKALVPRAFVLGSNEKEFWLAVKPKEISTYWWGRWSEQDSVHGFLINPKTLLDGLGINEIDTEQEWSLSNEGPFDILTRSNYGKVTKKIYIYSCDYRTRKIEYFDPNEEVSASIEMSKYKEISEGCFVPSIIEAVTNAQEDPVSIILNLKSIKPYENPDALFYRRAPRGFETVYRVVNGRWIEQTE
jgi:hypothetical protein